MKPAFAYTPPATTTSWDQDCLLDDLSTEQLWEELERLLEYAFPTDTMETVERYRAMTLARLEGWSRLYRHIGGEGKPRWQDDDEERHAPLFLAIGQTIALIANRKSGD